ncbi:TetR/AcrR family transcriptional regulator [Gorillibacterium sp. sgz5001074]|uniref:TetR/AcrR family transcriptional regulator n=1 Tax=Gorillibacterium sp. sgz5001074 TaxID=3446695 RepID=UPI003F67F655
MSPRIGADLDVILRAAAEIADDRGLEEVTLASVAQKLNIRSPSLYNHVDGLPGLRRKLAAFGMEQLYGRLSDAVEGRRGEGAVRALATTYVDFARSNPGLYAAALRAPGPGEEELAGLGGRLVKLVLDAMADYALPQEAALHAVRGLRSIIHGFSALERQGAFGLKLQTGDSLQLLLDAFLTGIEAYRHPPLKRDL